MKISGIGLLYLFLALCAGAYAQSAGQDFSKAGSETKNAARDGAKGTGKAVKTGAKKTKNGVKNGTHAAASGVQKGAAKVEQKTK